MTPALTLLGLLGACVGIYGVLDTTTGRLLGRRLLVAGLVACVGGLWSWGGQFTDRLST